MDGQYKMHKKIKAVCFTTDCFFSNIMFEKKNENKDLKKS